jgi:RHS repeat-associated protein
VKEDGQTIARYSYDPFGRRYKKELTKDGQTTVTYFLYSDEGLLAELNGAGQITAQYGFTPDGLWGTNPVYRLDRDPNAQSSTLAVYHVDHLGTPQSVTNTSGAVLWSQRQKAFGEMVVDASSTMSNNLRFRGQYFDQETGKHYNYFRDYEPATGRYVQSDPVGLWAGPNTYLYVRANSLRWVDPLGLYIPEPTENCWPNILTDKTYFTGKTRENLGPEFTMSLAIPQYVDTPWSSAPDVILWYRITYHSQDYVREGLYERLRSYDYVCKFTDECGKVKYESVRGYDTQSSWKEIDSGTYRWITRSTDVTQPYPIPDPNNPKGPLPPPRLPIPVP